MSRVPEYIKCMEIFKSLNGEGINTGRSTAFVRTLGCNLDCFYCDTGYRPEDDRSKLPFQEYTMREIINRLKYLDAQHICFTGGEPMLHTNFLYSMIDEMYAQGLVKRGLTPFFTFETNGTVLIDSDEDWRRSRSVAYTMDIKPFVFEKYKENYHRNLIHLKPNLGDEVKLVITGERDLTFAHEMISKYPNNEYILSPVTLVETKEFIAKINHLVSDYVMKTATRGNVRVGIQVHKLLDVR